MDFSRVGKKIYELRKYQKMTQADLAKGICTQAQISKIENGTIIPYSNTLFEIAERLGTDIYYFFDDLRSDRPYYAEEVFYQIRELITSQDYKEVRNVMEQERNNPLFQSGSNLQFFLWHKGICAYHVDKDPANALSLLQQSLQVDEMSDFTERKGEIYNSIAVILNLEDKCEEAIAICEKTLKQLQAFQRIKDPSIPIRLLYTLSKSLTKVKDYEESISCCEEGITLSLHARSLYILGELYYQKGKNLVLLNDYDEALSCCNNAFAIFKATNQDHFGRIVEKEQAFLREKLKSYDQ
ncbi:helix-turn-helix domain-containing protein [Thalassobacillus sp. C254]|uniref:helix-turn-helix domain-containing protein n=1 Tax=Thalassobacillus sp. C254 TaxID=1225341 RepID=UPI0006CF6328|nr:helix-turn-helix domain-containing protein [Thalassobacillus sp. C254]